MKNICYIAMKNSPVLFALNDFKNSMNKFLSSYVDKMKIFKHCFCFKWSELYNKTKKYSFIAEVHNSTLIMIIIQKKSTCCKFLNEHETASNEQQQRRFFNCLLSVCLFTIFIPITTSSNDNKNTKCVWHQTPLLSFWHWTNSKNIGYCNTYFALKYTHMKFYFKHTCVG